MSAPAKNQGSPRPIPLDRADELGIRQVLDREGRTRGNLADPDLPEADARMFYETMVMLRAIDQRGWQLQRSGQIAFWIPMRGQEAVQVGATHAMRPQDWIFRAHREMAPWLMRGASLTLLFAQFFGAQSEPQKGRRLPCLVGNRRINMIQGPTQVGSFIPHACGVAWAARLRGRDVRVLGLFGDGATSRSEFHSAMNFAGIHRPPVVFLCVNNAWAVSTPLDRQTAQPNFAAKGDAYALPNLRVDGNDALAVYAVMRDASARLETDGPTLIEAITWRQGFHTSSDNPDLYRSPDESERWEEWDPLKRMQGYLRHRGWWDEDAEQALQQRTADAIRQAVEEARRLPLPGPESQFEDVFAGPDPMLEQQQARILRELREDAG